MSKIITWDWSQQIDIGELQEILKEFGVAIVNIEDTGSDQCAAVIGKYPLSKEDAQKEYNKWCVA